MRYAWSGISKGYVNYNDADADACGRRIAQMRRELKRELDADDVLSDAKRKDSPLHAAFLWDDGDAAERYRRLQATNLIVCLVRVEKTAAGDDIAIRAYVSVQRPDDRRKNYFMPTEKAMADASIRAEVIERALNDFKKAKSRWEHLQELAPIFGAIQTVSADVAEEKTMRRASRRKKKATAA